MVGHGGTATDLWQDRRLLLTPLSSTDAAAALRSLRIWPLLAGYRGQVAADVDSLQELVVSVGRLAEEVPELVELDLNPVLVGPGGVALVDVKARLARASGVDDGVPRVVRQAQVLRHPEARADTVDLAHPHQAAHDVAQQWGAPAVVG